MSTPSHVSHGDQSSQQRSRGTAAETHHSKEDALSEREFVQLVRAASDLPDPQAFEARFICYAAGKLGMRGGEIIHMSADWINWSSRCIEIPEHDPCTKGAGGEICGYCREMAERRLIAHNLSIEEAREAVQDGLDVDLSPEDLDELARSRMAERNMTYAEAMDERWKPKTDNGVRSIPFDFDARTGLVVEEFADRYDTFPKSRCTINRRVDQVQEASPLESRVYPHSLRATAAGFHAARGVSAYALMAIMGWNDIQTARSYIQASDETAAKEIRSKHR